MKPSSGGWTRREAPRGVIGMIHLAPLPGSPRWAGSMAAVIDRARTDAGALAEGGVDALLVENFGDAPFHPGPLPPEAVAALAVAAAAVAEETDLPLGVNALRNDAAAALAVAAAVGAAFIRVNVHTGAMATDQGWIEGRAHETLRERERLAPAVAILADVLVKHATAPAGLTLERAARDAWERGLADALIVSGEGTGEAASPGDLDRVRGVAPDAPLVVGSGVTERSVRGLLEVADAVIVGTALERDGVSGAPVELGRVRRLVSAARR
ncbi:MAG TPA: BtpA/SgcQ family protein [Longimicrobiales bacterium]|nr:BtpA/SgcQ family protein [Longimicrobiales bacterium]